MPTLPIPLISALILGFLFLRLWLTTRKLGPLALLLGLCALQALIISLAQHYGLRAFSLVQPVTATLIPPMALVAFQTTALRAPRRSDLANLAAPLAALVVLATVPPLVDVLIACLFLGYGAAILWRLRGRADALPRLRLEAGELPARVWRVIAIVLMASALSDVLIVVANLAGASHLKPWIISLYSVANLLTIGALSLSEPVNSFQDEGGEEPVTLTGGAADIDTSADAETMARLTALMRERRPFLDPDLTLSKLSRQLRIPAKQLSATINRATGQNVSRFVNDARIAAAQDRLRAGDSVTQAMFASGFNTKSNFNREFLRVAGASPSAWLAAQ